MSVPVRWPKYDHHYKRYLEITTPMNEKSVKSRPDERRFYFWNNMIPSLTSGPIASCVQPNLGQYAFLVTRRVTYAVKLVPCLNV